MHKQRIAIIGAGTAGLASAILLVRQGHDVTLFERADALAPVGAGILLQPSGLAALEEMGCLSHILDYGHRVDALLGLTRSGNAIMNVAYGDLGEGDGIFGLGVHRATLCHVLDEALSSVPHNRHFGCQVESVEDRGTEAVVRFRQENNEHSLAFDAVLVANGSASQLRPASLVRYDRQYPWGAMWLIRPLTESLTGFRSPVLQQRYHRNQQMAGMLPTGRVPGNGEDPMVSFFWSLPVANMAQWQEDGFDLVQWKHDVLALWPDLDPLLETIQSPSELLPATYRDVVMSQWGQGRVGVIGDAAHAMSPQLGQGANMALLDAVAVARSVEASTNWDEVWAGFDAQRSGSIRFYQRMSWLLTPMFQSHIGGMAWVRNLSLTFSQRVPWLKRQMAETVAGRKQKWW
ncbi:FAD-dependent oxidoreductase [Marinobacter sp. 1Y8]